MKYRSRPQKEHAGSRYMCVTTGVIEALQRAYAAGRDLGQVVPGIDADKAAVIMAETLEADRVWNLPPESLLGGAVTQGPMSDFKRAALAELAFGVADVARDQGKSKEHETWWAVAMASLEDALDSPLASPLLWYEDIYVDLAYAAQGGRDQESIRWVESALAYNKRYHKGNNTLNLLRDLADMHLAAGHMDQGIAMLTALLQHAPADIWTYNAIAISFDRYGLAEIAAQAARRGLKLLDAKGDPEKLRGQLNDCLEQPQTGEPSAQPAQIAPEALTNLRAALALDFDSGQPEDPWALCLKLVPGVDKLPVKRPMKPSDLPLPKKGSQRAEPLSRPTRNASCWCGSGKKYKHCHMQADMDRKR